MKQNSDQNLYLLPLLALLLLPAFSAMLSLAAASPFDTIGSYISREFIWKSWGVVFVILMWGQVAILKKPVLFVARFDLVLLGGLAAWSLYMSLNVALVPWLALQQFLVLALALLVGYFSYIGYAFFKERFANALYFAAVAGIVLHIPFVFFIVYLKMDVAGFPWKIAIPGIRGIRPYNYFLEIGIAVAVGGVVFDEILNKTTRYMAYFALVLLWMMLFWSGGRGAMLSVAVALFVVSMMFPAKIKALWAVAIITGLLGMGLSFLLWVPPADGYGAGQMLRRSAVLDANAVSSGRLNIWGHALDYFKEKPLFGYGLNQFRVLFSTLPPFSKAPVPHAHNLVLELLLTWGLVGAAFVALLITRIWLKIFVRMRRASENARLPAFLALMALSAHSLISGTYYHVPSLLYMAMFAGICLVPNPAQNENTNG